MKDGRGDEETRRRGEKGDTRARPDFASPRLPVPLSPRLPVPSSPSPLKEGEDFYREGAVIVFTARYHLKRGYCCESGCRHCPYRTGAEARGVEFEKEDGDEA